MKKYIILVTSALLVFAITNKILAQQQSKSKIKHRMQSVAANRYSDSLIKEIRNTIFNTINNPQFGTKCVIPTFTVLKVDIDNKGKVTAIGFSDSADSSFINAYSTMPKYHNDKFTLEKYAKIMSYKNISILIPINYEPLYDIIKGAHTYEKTELLLKYKNQDYNGKSVVLSPIIIRVLSKGNS